MLYRGCVKPLTRKYMPVIPYVLQFDAQKTTDKINISCSREFAMRHATALLIQSDMTCTVTQSTRNTETNQ